VVKCAEVSGQVSEKDCDLCYIPVSDDNGAPIHTHVRYSTMEARREVPLKAHDSAALSSPSLA